MTSRGEGHVFVHVDDHPMFSEAFAHVIARLFPGIEIMGFADAESVPDVLQNIVPTLLILDLNLPRMHGTELLATLAKKEFVFPVLILSGDDSVETKRVCRRIWGNSQRKLMHLSKAESLDVIAKVIAELSGIEALPLA